MSNVQALLSYLDTHEPDLTTVAALTDALQEERDMTRSEADRFAERAVQASVDARAIATAARLMQSTNPWYGVMSRLILHVAGSVEGAGAQILLGSGSAAPKLRHAPEPLPGGFWAPDTVLVGAEWVMYQWHHNPTFFPWRAAPKRKRSRSR